MRTNKGDVQARDYGTIKSKMSTLKNSTRQILIKLDATSTLPKGSQVLLHNRYT